MLRVTSGEMRGFKLEVPRSTSVRPPLEMLREAVFNILGQDLAGWRVADLFAGSGIMGIEALSRGASEAVFVEKDRDAVAVIKRNLEKTGLLPKGMVIGGNAFSSARRLAGRGPIDAVFVDPPFAMMRNAAGRTRLLALVGELFASGELAADALVILRAPEKVVLEVPDGFHVSGERQYGHSRLFFFAADAGTPDAAAEDAAPEDEAEGPA